VNPPSQPARALDRRAFLGLLGLGAAAACSSSASPIPPPPSRSSVAPTSTTPSATAGPVDWAALQSKLSGTLVLPSSPEYDVSRELFDFRYDNVRPQAIAYCASVSDVQNCLEVARTHGINPRARCGGHSYAGYSTGTGLIIDVTRMAQVEVDAQTATIGAGARLIDVYNGLAADGVALPAGSCPTVGISGLTLGGGIGVVGRKLGLTCDRLESVQLVTADGAVHTCSAESSGLDGDLFWASRGGGGGNFGVVTSFTFNAVPAPALSTFAVSWPWAAAADVVNGWLQWAPTAPDEIWSTLLLIAHPDGTGSAGPQVRIFGVYMGSASTAAQLVNGLIRAVGSSPASNSTYTPPDYLSAMLYVAGCSGKTVAQCHLPTQNPQGQLTRQPDIAASDYVDQPLSAAGVEVLVDFVNQRQANSALGPGGAQFDSYGGAINRVKSDATAFAHRSALAGIQRSSSFTMSDSDAVFQAGRQWLDEFTKAIRPYVSGGSYVNYIDPDLADYKQAYYGSNLARLEKIKKAADPDRLFDFPQAV
jgi:FAD/FMN-containing dehydrogenase